MTPPRAHLPAPYVELPTPAQMHEDARACGANLSLPIQGRHLADAAERATRPAPSILADDQPRERPKRGIEISEAAARLAAAIYG